MNIYVTILWRGEPADLDLAAMEEYLPKPPDNTHRWRAADGRTEAICFTYAESSIAGGSYLYGEERTAVVFDGFPLPSSGFDADAYPRDLPAAAAADSDAIGGEFSLVYLEQESFRSTSSLGGSNQRFYVANDRCIAVSNRIALLLQLPGVSRELDPEGAQWLVYQGYMQRGTTAFRDVRRVRQGAVLNASTAHGLHIANPRYEDMRSDAVAEAFARSPVQCFEEHKNALLRYVQAVPQFNRGAGMRVPLSGGKDSRIVLGLLLAAGLEESIEDVYTIGPLYSPDVISAQELVKKSKLECHDIRRPAVLPGKTDLWMGGITRSLNIAEGSLSLYDILGFSPRKPQISVSGHQNVRDDYYALCSAKSLSLFQRDVFRTHFHDPVQLLRSEVRTAFLDKYAQIFAEYRDEGVPLSDLGAMYMVRERNGAWTATMCHGARHSAPASNPLMQSEVFRFVFSLPAHVRHEEMYHFMLLHRCAPDLTAVPFANDQWSQALRERLQGTVEVPVVTPYRWHRSFPNMSNPYLSSAKMEYFQRMKPLMRSLLKDHQPFVEQYLDLDVASACLGPTEETLVPEILCCMGLYTTLLYREYGTDLLHRTRNTEIAEELRQRVQQSQTVTIAADAPQLESPGRDEAYETIVEQHEASVAAFVRELQGLTQPAPDKTAPAPPWRHIHVRNPNDRALTCVIVLELNGGRRVTKECPLAPGAEFVWGIKEIEGSIRVTCDEIGHAWSAALQPTVMKYFHALEAPPAGG